MTDSKETYPHETNPHPRELVYRIMTAAEWEAFLKAAKYEGAAIDHGSGYLHLSTAKQTAGTLERYFNHRGDLVILAIDATVFGDDLKYDPVEAHGGELFPHLYRPFITLGHVVSSVAVPQNEDGSHTAPDFSTFGMVPYYNYNVACEFDKPEGVGLWLSWLMEGKHIEEVMNCGAGKAFVVRHEVAEGAKPKYEVRYIYPSKESFDRYVEHHAPRLRQDGLTRFGGLGLNYSRSTSIVVSPFYA